MEKPDLAGPRGRLFLAAAVFCVLATAAPAQAAAPDEDPYTEEGSEILGGEPPASEEDEVVGEELEEEGADEGEDLYGDGIAPREFETEDEPREPDGAAARRELLFRDGLTEREQRYPRGLEPLPAVERSDLPAFDARYRGRNAEILRATRPGLVVNTSISAGMFVDDNPLLETPEEAAGESTETWGWFVEPRIAVARRTPRTLFQGVLRLPYDDFESFEGSANDDLGSFDQYLGLQLDIFGRENAINVFANVANATTRTELVVDTGTDLSDERVLTFGGGASFKHAITPDSVVQLSAAARRQEFGDDGDDFDPDEVDTLPLFDSTWYQAALDFRMIVTATDMAGVGAVYEAFQPDDEFVAEPDDLVIRDYQIVTALANWSRDIGPSLVLLLEGGGQIIYGDQSEFTDSQSTVSPFVEASLFWAATSRDRFFFSYSHAAYPSGTGDLRTSNILAFEYRRIVTRNISLGVPLLAVFQDEAIDDTFDSRTFFRAAPNLVWTFGPHWALSAEYRFRLDKESDLSAATSNAAFLTVTWFGQLVP